MLAKGRGEVLEINVRADHVHMVLWIPPKYSVSALMGYLKGKLAIRLFQKYERIRTAILGTPFVGTRLLCQHR